MGPYTSTISLSRVLWENDVVLVFIYSGNFSLFTSIPHPALSAVFLGPDLNEKIMSRLSTMSLMFDCSIFFTSYSKLSFYHEVGRSFRGITGKSDWLQIGKKSGTFSHQIQNLMFKISPGFPPLWRQFGPRLTHIWHPCAIETNELPAVCFYSVLSHLSVRSRDVALLVTSWRDVDVFVTTVGTHQLIYCMDLAGLPGRDKWSRFSIKLDTNLAKSEMCRMYLS